MEEDPQPLSSHEFSNVEEEKSHVSLKGKKNKQSL